MEKIVWLFPLIFIFHDMEEIIGIGLFLKRKRKLIENKFPKLLAIYEDFSTEGFALAVFEELILCISISLLAVITKNHIVFLLWFGGFVGCTLHFVVHIVQSLIIRTYIPALITSIICLPVSIYIVLRCLSTLVPRSPVSILCTFVGIVLVAANLRIAQRLIGWFTRKMM